MRMIWWLRWVGFCACLRYVVGLPEPGETGVHAQFEGGCQACVSEVDGPLIRRGSGRLLLASVFEDFDFAEGASERGFERLALTGLLYCVSLCEELYGDPAYDSGEESMSR